MKLYLHSSNTPSWCSAQLKHSDKFAFTFYFYVRFISTLRVCTNGILTYSYIIIIIIIIIRPKHLYGSETSSSTLKKVHRLRLFQKKEMITFEPECQEVVEKLNYIMRNFIIWTPSNRSPTKILCPLLA